VERAGTGTVSRRSILERSSRAARSLRRFRAGPNGGPRSCAHPAFLCFRMSRRNSPLCRLSPVHLREGLTLLGTRTATPDLLGWLPSLPSRVELRADSPIRLRPAPLYRVPPLRQIQSALARISHSMGTRFYRIALQACLRRRPTSSRTRDVMKAPNACPAAEKHAARNAGKPTAVVDEYYFWLVEGVYYIPPKGNAAFKTTSAEQLSVRLPGRLLRPDAAAVFLLGGSQPVAAIAGVARSAHGPSCLVPGA